MTTLHGGTVVVRHHRVELALHRLHEPDGGRGTRPLLCLHGLGSRAAELPAQMLEVWPGPVWGLDFTGHGSSSVPVGGGYSPELLMADADHALGHLGPAALAGFGLGAYVALLLAGARPAAVLGALLADGPGLDGGRIEPARLAIVEPPLTGFAAPAATPSDASPSDTSPSDATPSDATPDPFALAELAADVRPPAYALGYARSALAGGAVAPAIVVTAAARPPWLAAVAAESGVEVDGPAADGLRWGLGRLSAATG